MTREQSARFLVGDKVKKVGGDYTFVGVVVARFTKLSGLIRYVVEDDRGVLHVYNDRNLEWQHDKCSSTPFDYGGPLTSEEKRAYNAMKEQASTPGCPKCGERHPPDGMCP